MRASGVELAQSIKRLESLLELLKSQGGAVAAASRSTFTWQPGGTANPAKGVYATLPTLAAALNLAIGPKDVGVDTSLGTATIDGTGMPAAGWNFDDVNFMPAIASVAPQISIAVGAKISPTTVNLAFRQCIVLNNATATVWTPGASGAFLRLNTSALESTAAGAFVDVSTQTAVAIEDNSVVGDGTHTVFNVEAAGTLSIALNTASLVRDNAIAQGTAPGGVVQSTIDASAFMSPTQGAGPVYTQSIADPQPTFVFAPGAMGTQNANVFTTFAELMQAVQQVRGLKDIWIDDSADAAHATAGQWNLQGCTFFASQPTTTTIDPTVTIFRLMGGTTFQSNNTATPVFTPTATNLVTVIIDEESQILSAEGAQPFVRATQNFAFQYVVTGGASLGGPASVTGHALTIDAGVNAFVFAEGASFVNQHAIAGAGTLQKTLGVETTFSATQDVAVTVLTLLGSASQVKFTPTTGANWNPVPTTSQGGLDQLAASNSVSATGNAGTGTGAVTVTTGNITKAKNGKMQVSASCALSTSAACTLTLQLVRDAATNIGTAKSVVAAAAINAGDFIIKAIDNAPDNAAHTYKLSVTASAGNITVAANSAQIEVVEDS
jgi:hypothetical protein